MTPDEVKNHALFAGGIGAFVRLAVVKPKSILLAALNVLIGGACSWFFSPIVFYYLPDSLTKSTFKDHASGAVSFMIGFVSLWVLAYLADLMNESKGNPIAVLVVIKNQLLNIAKPQSTNTDDTNTSNSVVSKSLNPAKTVKLD